MTCLACARLWKQVPSTPSVLSVPKKACCSQLGHHPGDGSDHGHAGCLCPLFFSAAREWTSGGNAVQRQSIPQCPLQSLRLNSRMPGGWERRSTPRRIAPSHNNSKIARLRNRAWGQLELSLPFPTIPVSPRRWPSPASCRGDLSHRYGSARRPGRCAHPPGSRTKGASPFAGLQPCVRPLCHAASRPRLGSELNRAGHERRIGHDDDVPLCAFESGSTIVILGNAGPLTGGERQVRGRSGRTDRAFVASSGRTSSR
jgi:hypothetical protein